MPTLNKTNAQTGSYPHLSATKRHWHIPAEVEQGKVDPPPPLTNLHKAAISTLVRRGHTDPSAWPNFLEPRLQDMPDPKRIKDAEKAASQLFEMIKERQTIGILTDYDVDGSSAAALLVNFLRPLNVTCHVAIPKRIIEGYGPNQRCLDELAAKDISLLVTLDCGAAHQDMLGQFAKLHSPVIIIDHHLVVHKHTDDCLTMPAASLNHKNSAATTSDDRQGIYAHVNPNRQDDTSGFGDLCATGVLFMVLIILRSKLLATDISQFASIDKSHLDLKRSLDLVALATVCDVVPLKNINRSFVRQGLKVLGQGLHYGLSALWEISKRSGKPTARDLGFTYGPRLNAGSRMGSDDLAFRLLSAPTESTLHGTPSPRDNAIALDEWNYQRRQAVARAVEEASLNIDDLASHQDMAIFCHSENWTPGIIGLIASHMVGAWNKPVFVGSLTDGHVKGSARSANGLHVANTISAAVEAGILDSGGGHAMAGGFAMESARINDFREFLRIHTTAFLTEEPNRPDHHFIDAALTLEGCTTECVKDLDRLAPFGNGNPEPLILIRSVNVLQATPLKGNHLKLRFGQVGQPPVNGICFQCLKEPLGIFLMGQLKMPIDIVCHLREDSGYYGIQLHIVDAQLPIKNRQHPERT